MRKSPGQNIMKQFGIMTHGLDSSQQGSMIVDNLNKLTQNNYDIDPILFYREYHKPISTPYFTLMNDIEAWNFHHPVIATDVKSARRLLDCPGPSKKFLYIMNLEWLYINHAFSYETFAQVYTHDDLNLIARSDEHAKIITNCWKPPMAIIKDFNEVGILEMLGYI